MSLHREEGSLQGKEVYNCFCSEETDKVTDPQVFSYREEGQEEVFVFSHKAEVQLNLQRWTRGWTDIS